LHNVIISENAAQAYDANESPKVWQTVASEETTPDSSPYSNDKQCNLIGIEEDEGGCQPDREENCEFPPLPANCSRESLYKYPGIAPQSTACI